MKCTVVQITEVIYIMRQITGWAAGIALSAALMGLPVGQAAAAVEKPSLAVLPSTPSSVHSARVDKVRLTWDYYRDAVRYRLEIWDSPEKKKILYRNEWVCLPGREIEVSSFRKDKSLSMDSIAWTVTPLNREGKAMSAPSKPQLLKDAEIRPEAPKVMTEYDRMGDAPIYLVYAWLAVPNASSYEVELRRVGEDGRMGERVRHLYAYENIVYDENPLLTAGKYMWRVRALDESGRRYSEWSKGQAVTVEGEVKYAALGDSITHGGGAISTPPCTRQYNWESYTGQVFVKNLGCSGNTTADMLERFERDVLPFSPAVLVIFGGVNDFRDGVSGESSVANLARMRDMCHAYGITPVFVTATPIRPDYMHAMEEMEPAAPYWRNGQETINEWVRQQEYHVDIAEALTDENGELRSDYTSDGLHPDAEAKKIIGEAIGAYLKAHFE